MSRRILVATDGSAGAKAAVDAAIGLARDSGASVVGLHVMPIPPLLGEGKAVAAGADSADAATESLGYVERRAAQAGIAAEVLTRRDDAPSAAILAVARELRCDLIAMGAHGAGGSGTHGPGSQVCAVLAHGALPVLVVPVRHSEG